MLIPGTSSSPASPSYSPDYSPSPVYSSSVWSISGSIV